MTLFHAFHHGIHRVLAHFSSRVRKLGPPRISKQELRHMFFTGMIGAAIASVLGIVVEFRYVNVSGGALVGYAMVGYLVGHIIRHYPTNLGNGPGSRASVIRLDDMHLPDTDLEVKLHHAVYLNSFHYGDDAIALLEPEYAKHPDNVKLMAVLGKAYLEAYRYAEAIAIFEAELLLELKINNNEYHIAQTKKQLRKARTYLPRGTVVSSTEVR